jgi:hypothetical protein
VGVFMQSWTQSILAPRLLPLVGNHRIRTIAKLLIAFVAAVFCVRHAGELASMERMAERAYSKAQRLIHDADAENRKVKPLPFVSDVDSP